jgi:prephenate dehydrogenase
MIVIIGLGLIGGSLLRAFDTCGWDADPVIRYHARQAGFRVPETLDAALDQASCLIVATPPEESTAIIQQLTERQLLIIDTCSIKQELLGVIGPQPNWLPAHPLVGSERSGWDHASSDLITASRWALCPHERTSSQTLLDGLVVLDQLQATALVCSAPIHDETVATTSHLPHLVSGALVQTVVERLNPSARVLHGGAWRDMTRIADAPTLLWQSLFTGNRVALAETLEVFRAELDQVQDWLDHGDDGALGTWLDQARQHKQTFVPPSFSQTISCPRSELVSCALALGRQGCSLRLDRVYDHYLTMSAQCP